MLESWRIGKGFEPVHENVVMEFPCIWGGYHM